MNATESTSTADGALVIDGGVGIALNANIGGITTVTNVTDSTVTTDGALVVAGGAGIGLSLNVGGHVVINDTTDSTSTDSGALVVAGGVGVGASLRVTETVYANVLEGMLGGGDVQHDAYVLALGAETIEGTCQAQYADLIADPAGETPPSPYLVISPAALRSLMDSPYDIGHVAPVPNLYASNFYASSLAGGAIIATLSDIGDASPTDSKIITPKVLQDFINSPNVVIGSSSANDAFFDNVNMNSVSGSALVAGSSISGAETNKLVTPGALVNFLTAPTAIGSITRANGAFDVIAFNDIDSDNFATSTDMSEATSKTKIVTPSSIGDFFSSPSAIGSTKPNTGNFTTLTASSILGPVGTAETFNNAYFDTININAIAGNVIATQSDITAGTSTSLLVTPGPLASFLAAPYAIGSVTPAAGSFTDLVASTISGSVIPPDLATALDNTINNLVITPQVLSLVLQSPPEIGLTTANAAHFQNVELQSVSGSAIAEVNDIINGSDNTKIVTPANLKSYFLSPNPIGSTTPSTGNFSNLTASQIYGQIGDSTTQNDGYFDTLSFNTISSTGGAIASETDIANATAGKLVTSDVINAALQDSVVSIGSKTAAPAYFTDVTASTINGGVVADQTSMTGGTDNDRVVTPAALNAFLTTPSNIGTVTPALGTFTTLSATQIYGPLGDSSNLNNASVATLSAQLITGDVVAAYPDDFPSESNKVVVPSTLASYLLAPGPIGSTTSNTGTFTTMTASQVYGSLGDSMTSNDAYIANLTVATFAGDGLASKSDVDSESPPSNKLVSASVLSEELLSPIIIGATTPNEAKFTTVNASVNFVGQVGDAEHTSDGYFATITGDHIDGNMIATMTDCDVLTAIGGTIPNNKVVTPTLLTDYFASPGPLGLTAANSGSFTTVSASSWFSGILGQTSARSSAYIDALDAETITGDVVAVASTSDFGATPSTNKVVTPAQLQSFLAEYPTDIGSTGTPSTATFTSVTAQTLTGSCILTSVQAQDLTATYDSQVVSYGALKSFLEAPTAIGGTTAGDGSFATLTVNSFAGSGLAQNSDVNDSSPPSDRLVSAAVLVNALENSSVEIGKVATANANFNEVTATKIYAQVGDSTTNYAGTFTSVNATSGTFSDLTVTGAFSLDSQISPAHGGTGLSTYEKGDLIAATSSTVLDRLPVGDDYNVLYASSSSSTGMAWGIVLPKDYISVPNPTYQTSTQYQISKCTVRNAANNNNIIISGAQNLDISATGLNGIAVSSTLSGTVTSTGTSVVGDGSTNFGADFVVGDIIVSGSDYRVIKAINVGTNTITVDSAFTSDLSSASYSRGGLAPNTHYYIYALGHASAPGYILSTRCVAAGDTLVDLPSEYSTDNYRQLPYVMSTDENSELLYIVWNGNFASILSPQQTESVTSDSLSPVDFSPSVPKISTLVSLQLTLNNKSGITNYVKLSPMISGTFFSTTLNTPSNGTYFIQTSTVLNTNTQNLYASLFNVDNSSSADLQLDGYWVNTM